MKVKDSTHPPEELKVKRLKTPNVGENAEKPELSYIVGESSK
jgi:hypothetical protein